MDGRAWRAVEEKEEKDRDKTGKVRAADDFIKRALLAALFGKIIKIRHCYRCIAIMAWKMDLKEIIGEIK